MTDALDRLKKALADRYIIERELGAGGMATVYLAEDVKHHRKVAIKVLRPEMAAALGAERFHREIEIAANLNHPHILPLLDSGTVQEPPSAHLPDRPSALLYYVMPYIEGESLRDKLAREGELPIAEAVRILRDVVEALSHAHKHNVVHRDIKPDNVMLSEHHALVTDFGVAKAVSEATGRLKLTTEGVALGTPAYMSPEQASADPHIDHRADIYAVGIIAYELLTGRTPFVGNTQQELLAAHVTQVPDPVTKYRESVPPALAGLVMKCLEKKAADRWQSAEELLPQLEALATPSGGVTPTGMMPVDRLAKRRWMMMGAVTAATAVIVVVVVLSRLLGPSLVTIATSNFRAVTSEPGLEWHPALSPDGSQVAYVARRGSRQSVVIRSTLNIAGGGELSPTLELDESWELSPSWSPDGEFVRFRSCASRVGACSFREIAKYGGSLRSIDLPSNVSTCSWSPDGVRVACDAYPDSVVSYSVSDGTVSLVVVHPGVQWSLHSPVWSPDGRWIAYVNGNAGWRNSFNVDVSSIWMVDADGGEPLRVTGESSMDTSPAWLDDDHLLFVSNRDGLREVYVVEVGPMGRRGEPRKVPGVTDAHSISYSIAGRKLAFSKATVRQNIRAYAVTPGTLSISGGAPVTSDNAIIESHDISPDGEWIVFDSNLRGNQDIYTKPLEGGSPTPVTNSPLDDWIPRWSPDGNEIAFIRDPGAGEWILMVAPAHGGPPVQVATGPATWSPRWSPTGLDIAFTKGFGRLAEAWLVSREAIGGSWSEPVRLTDFGCSPTDWAPDGSGLLCRVGAEIMLVSPEGDVLRRYDVSTALPRVNGPKFSGDGSTIYMHGIQEDGAEGIWAFSTQGGEPNLVVAYDHVDLAGTPRFSVGPDRLYLTVRESESDIWVMDVEVGR
ncbi:protein kinase [Gemmatimonadota bacterium]